MPDSSNSGTSFAEQCLAAMQKRGFDSCSAMVSNTQKHELNAEFGEINLLRTNHNVSVHLSAIVDGKKGSVSLNRQDTALLDQSVDELWDIACASISDEANAFAEKQEPAKFSRGPESPDYDLMVQRIAETLDYTRATYPSLNLQSVIVDYVNQRSQVLNSNGVDFRSKRSHYDGQLMFTAKEGEKVSSFSYTGFALNELNAPLYDIATADTLLRQATEQVETRKVPGGFEGELLVTPDCLSDFLGFLCAQVSDLALLGGNSVYQSSLGEPVAAAALTLRSLPLDLPAGYFVTGDGYAAENLALVEKGLLQSYLLSLYGSKKTQLSKPARSGGCYVVDPGTDDRDNMIRSIDKGILITRFSGGRPNDKGDFSGIAKNSYYIENGEIQFPVSETMISGNMPSLLQNISAISHQRADFGRYIFPWVRMGSVNVS